MSRNFRNPMLALGILGALSLASRSNGQPRTKTREQLERETKLTEREEWNRAVDERKAAKRAAKEQQQ